MLKLHRINEAKLKPDFLADLHEALDPLPDVWVVTHRFREYSEQMRLWRIYQNGGPKAAPPGKSPHEYGLAIDVVLDDNPETESVEPNWKTTDPRWQALFNAIWKHPRLHSGRTFNDADHIEQLGWKNHVNPTTVG